MSVYSFLWVNNTTLDSSNAEVINFNLRVFGICMYFLSSRDSTRVSIRDKKVFGLQIFKAQILFLLVRLESSYFFLHFRLWRIVFYPSRYLHLVILIATNAYGVTLKMCAIIFFYTFSLKLILLEFLEATRQYQKPVIILKENDNMLKSCKPKKLKSQ